MLLTSFLNRCLGWVLKLVLVTMGLVLAVSLMAAALIVLLVSLIKSLLTGQKPAPAAVFGRFQRLSAHTIWPGAPRPEAVPQKPGIGEVVDVEAREIGGNADRKDATQAPK